MDEDFLKKVKYFFRKNKAKDLAFILAIITEVNKYKKSKNKIKIALHGLAQMNLMKNAILEFYLKDKEDKLRNIALTGCSEYIKRVYAGSHLPITEHIKTALRKNQVVQVTDFSKECKPRKIFLEKTKTKKSILFPLQGAGLFIINKTTKKKFKNRQIELIKIFVRDILKASIELALDNEKNLDLAIRDSLTNLYNHGYFKLQLERYALFSERYKTAVGLMMLDIDDFKKYNDSNGHAEGDRLLQECATILTKHTRKTDYVCRYGGEEFAIILPNANLLQTKKAAENIRKAIETFRFNHAASQPLGKISVSIGVGAMPFTAKKAKDLIEKTDKAMYVSKRKGKNRVTAYSKRM